MYLFDYLLICLYTGSLAFITCDHLCLHHVFDSVSGRGFDGHHRLLKPKEQMARTVSDPETSVLQFSVFCISEYERKADEHPHSSRGELNIF